MKLLLNIPHVDMKWSVKAICISLVTYEPTVCIYNCTFASTRQTKLVNLCNSFKWMAISTCMSYPICNNFCRICLTWYATAKQLPDSTSSAFVQWRWWIPTVSPISTSSPRYDSLWSWSVGKGSIYSLSRHVLCSSYSFLQDFPHLLACYRQVDPSFHLLSTCTVEDTSRNSPHLNFLRKVWIVHNLLPLFPTDERSCREGSTICVMSLYCVYRYFFPRFGSGAMVN